MRSKRLFVVGILACLGLVTVFGSSPALSAATPLLSELDADLLGITLDSGGATSAIDQASAVAAADGRLQPVMGDAPEIHHGQAARFQDGPEKSVWIVVYPGGRMPSYGPPGSKPAQVLYQGAIIDDTTAEYIRGFLVWVPAQ